MASLVSSTVAQILTQVRNQLVETTARFWSDSELISIMNNGVVDMWGAILDLHQDHYSTLILDGSVILRANQSYISGIPDDCFRITLIEPLDITIGGTGRQLLFMPKRYNHPDFILARTLDAQDPEMVPARMIYYQIVGKGAPVEPLKVVTAPLINADVVLKLAYNPVQTISLASDTNPVPGGSDNALKAYTVAYARAKETDDRMPDAGWMKIYQTEKQLLLIRLTPREEQEPDVVDDFFQGYGSY